MMRKGNLTPLMNLERIKTKDMMEKWSYGLENL